MSVPRLNGQPDVPQRLEIAVKGTLSQRPTAGAVALSTLGCHPHVRGRLSQRFWAKYAFNCDPRLKERQ